MSETDQAVASAARTIARTRQDALPPPRRPARRGIATKAKRIAGAALALVLAMFIWGLISPIGVTGVMIGAVVLALITMAVLFMSGEKAPDIAALPKTAIAQLPGKTDAWLMAQRRMLPAPAQTLVDGIGAKLDILGPQLATLDEQEPAAATIRRLLADELPGLVRGYERVPANLRRDGLDGLSPDQQLIDGLKVVDGELARMSEQMARGDVEALATQGKYLEYKYRGEPD